MRNYKVCSECKYWTGDMTVVGRECRNPVNQKKWASSPKTSGTAHLKDGYQKACKQFEEKE